jgi:hypothetical protein
MSSVLALGVSIAVVMVLSSIFVKGGERSERLRFVNCDDRVEARLPVTFA